MLVVGEDNAKLIYNYVGSDFIDFRFKNLLISDRRRIQGIQFQCALPFLRRSKEGVGGAKTSMKVSILLKMPHKIRITPPLAKTNIILSIRKKYS